MAGDIRTAWKRTLRRRELASADRAGRWARNRTWEYHLSYARREWWLLLVIVVGVPAAIAPLAMFSGGAVRWAIVGASVASGVWLAALYLVVHAGAAPKLMGVSAEERTVGQLQSLRRDGWRFVSGLRLKTEIDHVAVGPPGILVIETKWTADPWPLGITNGSRHLCRELDEGITQTRGNARQVRLNSEFRTATAAAPVRAVLVLWSASPVPGGSPNWLEDRGVTVVHGRFLRKWLGTLEGRHLGPEEIEGVWTALSTHIGKGDDQVEKTGGAQKPTLSQLFNRAFLQLPLGLLAGMYVLRGLIALHPPWWGLLLGCLGGVALGLLGRRAPRLWWAASGWAAVWIMMGMAFPVVFVIVLLR